jgi:hypothetical protein
MYDAAAYIHKDLKRRDELSVGLEETSKQRVLLLDWRTWDPVVETGRA